MVHLELSNLYKVAQEHGVKESEIIELGKEIPDLWKKFEKRNQEFYSVIDDPNIVKQMRDLADERKGKYDHIVVCGIGGSSLGTICLQQSLKHLFENELSDQEYPRLHVLDNIDPAWIKSLEDAIDYEKTLFIIVTKSGNTPEILSQYFYFRSECEKKNLDIKNHFIFITTPGSGILSEILAGEDFVIVPHANVGGRFAVLSSVGLLPAALIGIDIQKLLEGAQTMRDRFINHSWETNLSFQLAAIQYLLYKKGKVMSIIWPYSQNLIRLGDWYRQLLAESIGKAKNDKDETVNVGLTPIYALGVTDQHSQSQLYNEGPNDKFLMFLEVENSKNDLEIPSIVDNEKVAFLKGASFKKLLDVEMKATVGSLTKYDRPNITIKIDEVNEYTLGELFLFFEGSIAFLGELFEINAFDQPGVELSKVLTKEYLEDK